MDLLTWEAIPAISSITWVSSSPTFTISEAIDPLHPLAPVVLSILYKWPVKFGEVSIFVSLHNISFIISELPSTIDFVFAIKNLAIACLPLLC
jgi:hypothetical protein